MTAELAFGLIGCGKLGNEHAKCVASVDGARFVAYADAEENAARAALAAHGGDYATDDVTRLLADERLDAVYICTHHDSHAPLAVAAAAAGKHILIEKPLSLVLADCQAVAKAVADAGVWLMPAFKMRYYPLLLKARAFVPEPLVVVGQMMDNRWPDDSWAQDPVRGGANVYSQGCHTTDVIRWMARGEPTALWASGGTMTHPGHASIDQCVASIRFDSGVVASWVQGDAAQGAMTGKFFLQLFGQGRSVQLFDRFKAATFTDGERTWTERVDEEEGFLLENREFVAALRDGRPPELSVHDGVQATRMVLAADAAIRSGEVQAL